MAPEIYGTRDAWYIAQNTSRVNNPKAPTGRLSTFLQNPLWEPTRNPRLLFAIPFVLGVVSFYYIDLSNRIINTANILVAFFFIPIPLTIIIVVHAEIRKLAVRTYPNGPFACIA
ncbi:hypothetical protein H4S04_008978, partial [Coemansia sp. S16]